MDNICLFFTVKSSFYIFVQFNFFYFTIKLKEYKNILATNLYINDQCVKYKAKDMLLFTKTHIIYFYVFYAVVVYNYFMRFM